MKYFPRSISLLMLSLASVMTLMAQTNNPFIGKWEMNVAKSKFTPGPAPKSETVTITETSVTVEGTDPAGQSFKWSYVPSPGKAVAVDGLPNTTVVEKRTGNSVDHQWTGAGGVNHGHGRISADGQSMSYTQTGKDPQGHPLHDVYLFVKQ